MREATNRVDVLLRQIKFGGGVVLDTTLANLVHLLVHLRPVVVAVLTRTSNRVLHLGRVPCSNTGDFAEASVGLARQAGDAPAGDNALVAVTLGDADHVEHLILREDAVDGHLLLKEVEGEVDLGGDVAAIDLDLHQVRLLLTELQLADLGVREHADDLAVLLDLLNLSIYILLAVSILLDILSERLLLALVPVLVEPTLELIVKVLSPDSCESANAI
mmetsp:Transcript_26144/g.57278  ORF Transcript_26144/g.57278 Transcript_26144/m.57278 type:complete len:218 (-) Transcript_26144:330-983(-)